MTTRQKEIGSSRVKPDGLVKKRYVFVVNELGFIYSHFWDLATAIQEAGWDVIIVGARVSDPARATQAGMTFVEIRPTFGIGNPIAELESYLELRTAIRALQPDILHAISLKNVLLAGILARVESIPGLLSAITGLGTMFVEDRLRYTALKPLVLGGLRFVHKHRNSVLALENADDRKYFIDESVIQPQRAFLIPGAGLHEDTIRSAPRQFARPIILCVARMIRNKGILYLVEAAKLLRARGCEFELQLVGDIDPRNPTSLTEEELRNLQEDGVASWLGKRSDVSALLKSADIFCLPTYYREGMPKSLIEASAGGLPIVTSDVPGCREVVIEGVNGFLVPPQDASALANRLEDLIRSKALRDRMGMASRLQFENNFTTAHVLKAFDACYVALNMPLTVGCNDVIEA